MKDSAPKTPPKRQRKWSGGPPKPPKKPARDLLDGEGPGDLSEKVFSVVSTTSGTWFELMKLSLGGGGGPRIRESLELKLDAGVVVLGGLAQQAHGVVRESLIDCLNSVRDY